MLYTGPDDAEVTLLLAHGAGAPMDSDWMNSFAGMLGERGLRVARFEFGYMAGRRQGQRKPPPRGESLIGEYEAAVAGVERRGRLVIGGKSLGGRVASLAAQGLFERGEVAGLVCLGYPFHPPGRPEQLRTAHLKPMTLPALICQGTRDPFGTREEVGGYGLPPVIRMAWLEDGDHDFRPRKAISGLTLKDNLGQAADAVASFAAGL